MNSSGFGLKWGGQIMLVALVNQCKGVEEEEKTTTL